MVSAMQAYLDSLRHIEMVCAMQAYLDSLMQAYCHSFLHARLNHVRCEEISFSFSFDCDLSIVLLQRSTITSEQNK